MVAGDADGEPGQRVGVAPGGVAAGHEEVAQRGEEDLAVVGGDQVVEDGVDGRADVEQHVGEHVEVVVEVVQLPAGGESRSYFRFSGRSEQQSRFWSENWSPN